MAAVSVMIVLYILSLLFLCANLSSPSKPIPSDNFFSTEPPFIRQGFIYPSSEVSQQNLPEPDWPGSTPSFHHVLP